MDNEDFPGQIRYAFHTEEGAILRPAHGVWGGITPHGEIEMSFYDESSIPPQFSEQMIGPDGSPGPERISSAGADREIRRNIHSRILLNYQTARAIMDWLDERLNELDANSSGEIFGTTPDMQQ